MTQLEQVEIQRRGEKFRSMVEYHYGLQRENRTLWGVIERYVEGWNDNLKFFPSKRGYIDFMKERTDQMKAYRYKHFSHAPIESQLEMFHPVLKFVYSTDVLKKVDDPKMRDRPFLYANFREFPNYVKKSILRNKDEPIPLNPSYLTVEYEPFIEDESLSLDGMVQWLEDKKNAWNLTQKQITTLKSEVRQQRDAGAPDESPIMGHGVNNADVQRVRGKLDSLLGVFQRLRGIEPEFEQEFQDKLLGYELLVTDRELVAPNGVYLIRRNGKLVKVVHYLVYDSVEYWRFPGRDRQGIMRIQDYDIKYFHGLDKKAPHTKIRRPVLIFQAGRPDVVIQAREQDNQNIQHMEKIQRVEDVGEGKVINTLYIYKKRVYYNEEHSMHLRYMRHENKVEGMVRARGVRVVHIVTI